LLRPGDAAGGGDRGGAVVGDLLEQETAVGVAVLQRGQAELWLAQRGGGHGLDGAVLVAVAVHALYVHRDRLRARRGVAGAGVDGHLAVAAPVGPGALVLRGERVVVEVPGRAAVGVLALD